MAAGSPVLRNALILVGAQLAGTPLSLLVNAVMGRYLGAEAFGYIFLATTLARLGFLFVDWGHSGVLPAAVARDRSVANEFLGTSLVWRFVTSVLVVAVLAIGSWLLGYGAAFQVALALVSLHWILNTVAGACQDTIRGFERTDVAAWAQLGQQLLSVVIVIPVLLLGGGLGATLAGQAASAGIVTLLVWIATRRIAAGKLSFSRRAFNELFTQGSYFLSFGIAMAVQANVDAILLSKLAPVEVVGWQAAAQRIGGVLIIPSLALVSALYPTLSRLYVEDRSAFVDSVRSSLRGTFVIAVPITVACAVYRDVGIQLFSKQAFGPAEQNLLVFAIQLPLIFVSMPLGTALMAAGRQRAWAVVQAMRVVVSVVLDPILIPWFQERYGNGGIGVGVASVAGEVLMVVWGFAMISSGVLDRSLLMSLVKASGAGVLMVGASWLLGGITPYVAGPIVLVLYGAALWAIGGIDQRDFESVKAAVLRRIQR